MVVPLSDLEARTGCGEVIGSTATGTVLSPEVLRRVCCEADLLPTCSTPPPPKTSTSAAWCGCSPAPSGACCGGATPAVPTPGCTAPAAWSKAHHVVHWADGGASDIGNAALLCRRPHSFVYTRRLVAEVRRRPDDRARHVVWDLTPGG